MNFRRMRHRLTFQTSISVPDDMGGRLIEWVDAFTTWGFVRPVRAEEIYVAQRIDHEVTHEIRMRYRTGISPQMRIVFHDGEVERNFEITSLLNTNEVDKEIRLMVREVMDNGTN